MARANWKLIVDIYEPAGAGRDYPVVRHEFFGKTKDEANGYFEAHLGTCRFLRDCVTKSRWKTVTCEIAAEWQRVQ